MPLNEPLFNALWKMTGRRPHITRQGSRFQYSVVQTRAGKRLRAAGGEEYAVNCPACGDTRGRLYVHHMFGLEYPGDDPELRGPMDNLCYCQNEHKCIPLRKYLGPYETLAAQIRIQTLPSAASDDGVFEAAPPKGDCVPLGELPKDHQARLYLQGRGYDPDYLGRHFGVGVMIGHPIQKIANMACGRLVFPFTLDGEEVMWQARLAYDLQKGQRFPPKWYFPPNTKKIPWNLDLAANYKAVIACEGILSAVNMGPAGISIGGKSLTHQTIKRIAERWSCVVVALDPDAGVGRKPDEPDYQERAIAELLEAGIPEVYGVKWNPNDLRDPGDLGRSGCEELLRKSVPQVLDRLPYFRK